MYRCSSNCPGHGSAAESCEGNALKARIANETAAASLSIGEKLDRVIELLQELVLLARNR